MAFHMALNAANLAPANTGTLAEALSSPLPNARPPRRMASGGPMRRPATAVALLVLVRPRRRQLRVTRRPAALLEGTLTAVPLEDGKPADLGPAPPVGSRSLDQLGFLLRNPFARGLEVTSLARAELQASPQEVWKLLTGPQSWIALQLVECYGLPWPLELEEVEGRLEASAELTGQVGALGLPLRSFTWEVQHMEPNADGGGELELLGRVDGEDGSFTHRFHVTRSSEPSSSCTIESQVRYAPQRPLQPLLNALGGRSSQHEGHLRMLRRIGAMLDGDVIFDPVGFYNLIGRLIDLVAPFEDLAREKLATLAGLKGSTASPVKLLEIGSGSGRWARSLFPDDQNSAPVSKVTQYLGVDISLTMADEAARALAKLGNARVVRGDARREGLLEEACGSFLAGPPDRIVASYVLDILDDKDLQRLLTSCAKLLRQSGGLFAAAGVFPGSALMTTWESIWQKAPSVVGGCRPKDLRAKLEGLGWEILAVEVTDVLGYRSQVVLARPPAR
ncbi:unnamed protein product [Durusdinium trenchii]|uniref:Uncharacterized protein n=2 Tax=Durusdinium trenchii TaxID=1381693 RepID=A0ABP0MUL7_9DINO